MLDKETKLKVISEYGKNDKDTGSVESQVAIINAEILVLQKHFTKHKKDFHSLRGLMRKINLRKKLLSYLKKKDIERYKSLTSRLGIRA